MKKINVLDKYSLFDDRWSPRKIASLNGQQVIIAKVEGEFVWHQHEHEDELFYVVKGELEMQFRDHSVFLKPGEMLVVPKGVEHRPVAQLETWIMLFEPLETKHTGGQATEMTVNHYEEI